MRNYCTSIGLVLLTISAFFSPTRPTISSDVAAERARALVRMVDDISKSLVVFITEKYVHDEDDRPASRAAIALF